MSGCSKIYDFIIQNPLFQHGSLLAVQWLIHNTFSKTHLIPQNDSRSLLHVAARYGQVISNFKYFYVLLLKI